MYRSSLRYPGLRVKQLSAGTYEVEREHDNARYIVLCDPKRNIGAQGRWYAEPRTSAWRGRLVARTKDELMRALAGSAADAIRVVA